MVGTPSIRRAGSARRESAGGKERHVGFSDPSGGGEPPAGAQRRPASAAAGEVVADLREHVRLLNATSVVDTRKMRSAVAEGSGAAAGPPPELPDGLRGRAAAAFRAIDALCDDERTNDGRVTHDQLRQMLSGDSLGAEILFRELDANHSGDVTLGEWMSWLARLEHTGRSAANVLDWVEGKADRAGKSVHFDAADQACPQEQEQQQELSKLRNHVRRLRATSVVAIRQNTGSQPSQLSQLLEERATDVFDSVALLCSAEGRITKQELHSVMHEDALGADILFKELDANHSGDVTVEEWLQWLSRVELNGQSAANVLDWVQETVGDSRSPRTPSKVRFADTKEQVKQINRDVRRLRATSVVHLNHLRKEREETGEKAAPDLPDGLRDRVVAAFQGVDSLCSQDGSVSKEELHKLLEEDPLGADVLFRELDANHSGDVTLGEWVAWFARLPGKGRCAESMLEWFEGRILELRTGSPAGSSSPAEPAAATAPLGKALCAVLRLLRAGGLSTEEMARVVTELVEHAGDAAVPAQPPALPAPAL